MHQSIIGYDPGGNCRHGIAILEIETDWKPVSLSVATVAMVQAAIDFAAKAQNILGVGIDTLTNWSTGPSGWRPCDLWLREQYPEVRNSVVAPNSLRGSMSIGGMCFKSWASSLGDSVVISETHPKVAYFAVFGQNYDWAGRSQAMTHELLGELELCCGIRNDHEFDAAISCYAVLQGLRGTWPVDLRALPAPDGAATVEPFGASKYFWPSP